MTRKEEKKKSSSPSHLPGLQDCSSPRRLPPRAPEQTGAGTAAFQPRATFLIRCDAVVHFLKFAIKANVFWQQRVTSAPEERRRISPFSHRISIIDRVAPPLPQPLPPTTPRHHHRPTTLLLPWLRQARLPCDNEIHQFGKINNKRREGRRLHCYGGLIDWLHIFLIGSQAHQSAASFIAQGHLQFI